MIFDMLFVANWNKIGDYRQRQTNLNTAQIHSMQVDYDYKVGDKVLVKQDGILHKAESPYSKMSWTITTIWNNQDSMQTKIETSQYLKINSLHR